MLCNRPQIWLDVHPHKRRHIEWSRFLLSTSVNSLIRNRDETGVFFSRQIPGSVAPPWTSSSDSRPPKTVTATRWRHEMTTTISIVGNSKGKQKNKRLFFRLGLWYCGQLIDKFGINLVCEKLYPQRWSLKDRLVKMSGPDYGSPSYWVSLYLSFIFSISAHVTTILLRCSGWKICGGWQVLWLVPGLLNSPRSPGSVSLSRRGIRNFDSGLWQLQ